MATILHRIKAFLYINFLTKFNVNDYIARVDSERSLNVKEICETAAARGGSDISAPAMEHAVNLWLKEMAYQLCDGYSVNTGYFNAAVHIKGNFDSPNEHYNPEKHTLLFELHQGDLLRKELETVHVDVLGVADVGIDIAQVVDAKTGSVNDLLTPGRNLKITGHKLKVVGEKPGVGVSFISQDDPEAVYLVPADDIVVNNPSEVIIIIPQLLKDTYKLKITSQFTGSGGIVLKEPRSCVFDKILTVQ
jgi:hypothetical protein